MTAENRNAGKPQPFIGGVTGVILAGGKSSRFGSNKAFADVNGRQLIQRVIGVMRAVFEELILITNDPGEYSSLGIPMHADIIKGLGPLGGIYTGIENMTGRSGFFVACDMPFLNEGLIRHIAEMNGSGYDAVIPKIGWKMEPLHALYSKTCIPAIRGLIDTGECMINKFYQAIRTRFINEDEMKQYDPLLRSFYNINRPGELIDAISRESTTLIKKG